jgi:glycosyltransferase involved in cell wall biosynthesis
MVLGRPRRILVLNERDLENPLAGGAEVHVFEIFRRLVERGHTVQLLTASFRGAMPEVTLRGVAVRRLTNRYLYYARVPFALRRALATEPVDVVVDVLNKFPFLTPWVADVPCCAIVHHLFGRTGFRQVTFPVALATYLAEKLIPLAHRRTPMLAISASTRDDLVARGIAADNIAVVPPGLDRDIYMPGRSSRAPLVVWIGRLERYKRADVMIDAMPEILRHVPGTRLTIIGSGHARGALEEHARHRGVTDAVEFTGFVAEERKVAYLQRASLLVNTSEKEGFGLTVVEANACGTPSLATDVPGLRDSVRDGETGLLVPFGDAAALARAAVRVLTDERLSARLVANGLAWAARFSWERAADATEAMIEKAIAMHAATSASRPARPSAAHGSVGAR